MGKIVIWVLTLVGLAPSVAVITVSIFVLFFAQRTPEIRRVQSSGVFVHDCYFILGRWQIDFNPQYWSVALLLVGIALIIVSLVAILHAKAI